MFKLLILKNIMELDNVLELISIVRYISINVMLVCWFSTKLMFSESRCKSYCSVVKSRMIFVKIHFSEKNIPILIFSFDEILLVNMVYIVYDNDLNDEIRLIGITQIIDMNLKIPFCNILLKFGLRMVLKRTVQL